MPKGRQPAVTLPCAQSTGAFHSKSRTVDLAKGESSGFLGFEFRRVRSRRGVWRPYYTPQIKKRTK